MKYTIHCLNTASERNVIEKKNLPRFEIEVKN